ncbi:hypothetical protein CYPRO_0716 [Cyclonatronum proteinivorum]|uniref:DUF5683 domain-containing protein n=1 Tax=Cyclonatronum proteinivorum TaxID=1457365 RepID=A0A345UHP8_9BACT|nr:DUF5683 domain-containing protein [Cyclonatronum proteinivorum]AXI99999.1 hypothetical protein CYPRO_0716 [Cyclonatronum proteinivorum]
MRYLPALALALMLPLLQHSTATAQSRTAAELPAAQPNSGLVFFGKGDASALGALARYVAEGQHPGPNTGRHTQPSPGQSRPFPSADGLRVLPSTAERDTVPNPRDVMLRSLMLPGWGQYTNREVWKIPIVYGLIGGLGYYAYFADSRYRGYRAAFYNGFEQNTDLRFGPTPSWIPEGATPDFLRSSRDFYRNRRDFLIFTTVLAYGLNVLDAYVFAHMRDFDVSDDLSFHAGPQQPEPYQAAAAQTPVPLPPLSQQLFTLRYRF